MLASHPSDWQLEVQVWSMAAAAPSERGEEGEEGEGYESAEAAKEVSESTGALRVLDDPDGSTDEYDDDDQNGDLDGVAAEARVNELISQLDQGLSCSLLPLPACRGGSILVLHRRLCASIQTTAV